MYFLSCSEVFSHSSWSAVYPLRITWEVFFYVSMSQKLLPCTSKLFWTAACFCISLRINNSLLVASVSKHWVHERRRSINFITEHAAHAGKKKHWYLSQICTFVPFGLVEDKFVIQVWLAHLVVMEINCCSCWLGIEHVTIGRKNLLHQLWMMREWTKEKAHLCLEIHPPPPQKKNQPVTRPLLKISQIL